MSTMERSREVTYIGFRTKGVCKIRRLDPNRKLTTLRLAPSLKVRNHSPARIVLR